MNESSENANFSIREARIISTRDPPSILLMKVRGVGFEPTNLCRIGASVLRL